MVDFRVDDGLPWHPKTVNLSLEAVGLWTYAGCWCARYLTDGYIHTEILRDLARGKAKPIRELVDHNLLHEIEGGYLFVDWLQYQRSQAQVQAAIEATKRRSASYRARKREAGEP